MTLHTATDTTYTPEQLAARQKFEEQVAELMARPSYRQPLMWGIFLPQHNLAGQVIAGHYLSANYDENYKGAAVVMAACELLTVDMEESIHGLPETMEKIEYLSKALEYLDPFQHEEKKHINLQALNAIRKSELQPRAFYGVFVYDGDRCSTVASALLKLECYRQRPNFALKKDGVKEVLRPLRWDGNRAYDPEDLLAYAARGPKPNLAEGVSYLPPYLLEGGKIRPAEWGLLSN